MGGTAPLKDLCKLGVLEPQAKFFSRNRGRALLVRKGNPLGIRELADVARTGARIAQADAVEAGARAGNRAAIEALIGKTAADALFANEVEHFAGRLGITHRDVPEMIARGYYKPREWNDYAISAKGNHLEHFLNGIKTIDVTDNDPKGRALDGLLALQIHAGPPMLVEFKDILLQVP